jgi:hypothetical protein
MSGAIPPFPNMPLWCGAQLKKITGTILPFPFVCHYGDGEAEGKL